MMLLLRRRSLQIRRQQPSENLIIAEIDLPAISREHRCIEFLMGIVEPRRPLIVEVGQRALFEFSLA